MKNILLLITLIVSFTGNSQNSQSTKFKYPKLVTEFVSNQWGTVFKAKDSLLQIGKSAIPDLIKVMDNPKGFAKLENTADLIYPGATEFYGHGWVIDYDLDWIAIRAGWALENLTLQNFGFSENAITEEGLMELHKNDYAEYVETGKHDVNFEREKFKALEDIINKAKTWWEKNQNEWTPLVGLKEAIYSDDLNRQLDAIQQLRFPKYTIPELTQDWFDKNLKKRIEELHKSDDEGLVLQTDHLLRDGVQNTKR